MTPILAGIVASGISGHLTPPFTPSSSYDALASYTVGAGGVSQIVFSGLPTGGQYKHLQIRGIAKTNISANEDYMLVKLNNDTSASYAYHAIESNTGSGNTLSYNQTSVSNGYLQRASGNSATSFGTFVCDFLDFANTSKYKTYRVLAGVDNNGTGIVMQMSNLWMKTDAINSITILPSGGGNFQQYTQIDVYGVKG